MQSLKLQVSLMRLLGRVKTAFADAFAVHHDLDQPFVLVFANTQKTRLVGFSWFTNVLKIAKPGDLTEIFKTVVLLVAVFVIYVKRWLLSGHVQPRKTMSQSFLVVDSNCPVACVGWTTGTFANKIGAAAMCFPDKLARFWGVVKDGSKMVSGNHEFQFTIGMTK